MFRFPRLARIILEPDARVATGLRLAFVAPLPTEPLHNAPMIALAALGLARRPAKTPTTPGPTVRIIAAAGLSFALPPW